MAGVPVTIRGRMYRSGLHVGGGPMPPGEGGEGGGGEEPPLGIWGGANEGYPTHPIVLPPGFAPGLSPEHPIVIPPPPPLGIWGGAPPPYVDIGLPGPQPHPEHPIVIPPDLDIWGPTDPRPTHPIVIPPPTVTNPPTPTHPIVIPPDAPPEVLDKWDVVAYWTPAGGWGVAIVPGEGHDAPIVTPSGTAKP
jgi:hypothetical protein